MTKRHVRKTKRHVRKTKRHVRKTKSHVTKLLQSDPEFKTLVAKYGRPRVRGRTSSLGFNPGDICMMTQCYQGKRIVMRRDNAGNCTRYSEEAC
jgi:hypothetical protein